jgi:ribosomal protein S18 acetylase RimI-like enzyme
MKAIDFDRKFDEGRDITKFLDMTKPVRPGQEQKMIQIEQATEKDAEVILALQKLAYQSEARRYNDFTIPPLMQTFDEILADFSRQVVLKAVMSDEIIGSVRGYMEGGICYIGRLIVNPGFQKQGIGAKLMQLIESRFGNFKRYELFTGHISEEALSLYKKLGYIIFKQKELKTHTIVYLEKICI